MRGKRNSGAMLYFQEGPRYVERLQAELHRATWTPVAASDFADGRLVRVSVRNYWLAQPLGTDWIAFFRLAVERSVPIISEVRIIPRENGQALGEWSAAVLGLRARPPSGGVTARLLRQVRVGAYYAIADETFRRFEHTLRGESTAAEPAPMTQSRRRVHRPDAWYAVLAANYVEAIQAGDRAAARTAGARHQLSPSQARVELHEARRRGLLTASRDRIASGRLTAKARRLLGRRPGPVPSLPGTRAVHTDDEPPSHQRP